MKAIETTGRLEKSGILKLDKPIAISKISKNQKVKVIILYGEEDEIEEKDWLSSLSNNTSFSFLKNKREDIYSLSDGKPFNA